MTTKGRPLARPAPAGAATWPDRRWLRRQGGAGDGAGRGRRDLRKLGAFDPEEVALAQDLLPQPLQQPVKRDGGLVRAVFEQAQLRDDPGPPHWARRRLRGSTAAGTRRRRRSSPRRWRARSSGPAWRRRCAIAPGRAATGRRNSPRRLAGFEGADRDLVAGHAGIHVGLQLGGALDLPDAGLLQPGQIRLELRDARADPGWPSWAASSGTIAIG